jgi:N-ethylmaleimide reductase
MIRNASGWTKTVEQDIKLVAHVGRQRCADILDSVLSGTIALSVITFHHIPSTTFQMKPMTTLFDPLQVGDLLLPNRVILAPLTRCRASAGRVPNALNAEYYAQRASAGLILSEATSVDPLGVGYPDTPGIWSDGQVQGWKLITRAVHACGGKIFMQLWHVGRVSHPDHLQGQLPLAPSAIAPLGHVSLLRPQRQYVVPRALATDEIPAIVAAYRKGAENAQKAGFDGVELHGANGYLLDQFLQDSTNKRTDQYGGAIENRARLMLEATDAVISVWGAGRVGMHLAPRGDSHTMGDSNPLATFSYVADELRKRGIAFIFTRESLGEKRISPALKKIFGGVLIANEGFNRESAQQVLDAGEADAVSFGKLFISNPDLPRRLQLNVPLNPFHVETFYGYGMADPQVGYTDYPSLLAEAA